MYSFFYLFWSVFFCLKKNGNFHVIHLPNNTVRRVHGGEGGDMGQKQVEKCVHGLPCSPPGGLKSRHLGHPYWFVLAKLVPGMPVHAMFSCSYRCKFDLVGMSSIWPTSKWHNLRYFSKQGKAVHLRCTQRQKGWVCDAVFKKDTLKRKHLRYCQHQAHAESAI